MKDFKSYSIAVLTMLALLSFVVAMIVPLPGNMIDVCIVISAGLALLVFLRAISIEDWSQMKTFPTVLLMAAVFRIALSIATTRKILSDGEAGQIITSSGEFIASGNIFVGFVIFLILFVVQFIVVSQGTTRLAEVRARFTLDGLPMKQMSIDNDMNQGVITAQQAKERRTKLDEQVDYYGNMDGAGKFIKGDVIASIILFFVNIIFGIIIGIMMFDMTATDAMSHYAILTIGDGLVSQMCSLVMAVGAAIVMTRVYGEEKTSLAQDIFKELSFDPVITEFVAAIFTIAGVVGFFTNLPTIPFFIAALILMFVSYNRRKVIEKEQEQEKEDVIRKLEREKNETNEDEDINEMENIVLELGISLLRLVDPKDKTTPLLQDKIRIMKKIIAKESGMKVPEIRIYDNARLYPTNKYRIKIRGNVVGEGEIKLGKVLAMKTPMVFEDIDGEPTKDPVFQQEAIWINAEEASYAQDRGYMVNDAVDIIDVHLTEMITNNLHELLERQDVQDMMEVLGKKRKVLIEEVNENKITYSTIQKVMKNLLREKISIKDLPTIMEGVIDAFRMLNTMDPKNRIKVFNLEDEITILVRERISRYICEKNKDENGTLYCIVMNYDLQKTFKIANSNDGYVLSMEAEERRQLIAKIKAQIIRLEKSGMNPVLIVSDPRVRIALSRMMQLIDDSCAVISINEITEYGAKVEQLGVVE